MELVFFWIKGYEKIKSEAFNFSSNFQFSYNANKLFFEENNEAVNIFAENTPNISNVTVIVGENGSGKTTLLMALSDVYRIESIEGASAIPYIIIFFQPATEKNMPGEFFIWYSKLDENIEQIKRQEKYKFFFNTKSLSESICMVNYTNTFSCSSYMASFLKSEGHFYNLSLMQSLQSAKSNAVEMRVTNNESDPILNFFHKSTQRQMRALESANLPFTLSRLAVKKMNYRDIIQDLIKNKFSGFRVIKKQINDIFQSEKFDFLQAEDARFCIEGILFSLLRRIVPALSSQSTQKYYINIKEILEKWEEIISYNKNNITDDVVFIMKFVNVTMNKMINPPANKAAIAMAYKKTIKFLLEDEIKTDMLDDGILLNLNGKKNVAKIKAFYNNYLVSIGQIYDYLLFEWEMSTGEFAFFDLYATFYELGQKIQDQERQSGTRTHSMLILMDEADLYLHPKWQQKFVERILDMMPAIFEGKKIQIIFTTHSPIFLSDIPNHHIIYLTGSDDKIVIDTNIKKKTFAANIYNLYNDSFFLNDNKHIGIIGDYSNGIIKTLRENLESINKDLNNYEDDRKHEIQTLSNLEYVSAYRRVLEKNKKIIDLIGEPLIKNMLLNLWESANDKLSACFDDHVQNSTVVIEKFKDLTQPEQVKVMEFIIRNHKHLGEMK
ncbi:AAA family ATPase [Propionispira raffinosivorans]|uniref:AAA family ATPase n=1 Tax=Propionispira raffinosivorans TaxID=86959 RepID=UPI00037FC72C|nr:AAA family ATPase [Propionispira raffinosivorans]